MEESRKVCSKLEQHPLSEDEEADLAQAIVISAFRRPAALVPWSIQELKHLERAVRHDDVMRQIIVQELKAALRCAEIRT